jgi:ABC-type sugar transport system substrate-binding protein
VIAFAPVVESGWDTVLKEAKAAKIPVVLTDRAVKRPPTPRLYVTMIGSDFVEEGRKAGKWLLDNGRATASTSSSCRAPWARRRPSTARRALKR